VDAGELRSGTCIFAGPLLGVALADGTVQFHSWRDSLAKVGSPLPCPSAIHWDSTFSKAALAYKDHVAIYASSPTFSLLGR
jgi:hypothetical protein